MRFWQFILYGIFCPDERIIKVLFFNHHLLKTSDRISRNNLATIDMVGWISQTILDYPWYTSNSRYLKAIHQQHVCLIIGITLSTNKPVNCFERCTRLTTNNERMTVSFRRASYKRDYQRHVGPIIGLKGKDRCHRRGQSSRNRLLTWRTIVIVVVCRVSPTAARRQFYGVSLLSSFSLVYADLPPSPTIPSLAPLSSLYQRLLWHTESFQV